jgi:DNA-binding MarR family transcriptional regulator
MTLATNEAKKKGGKPKGNQDEPAQREALKKLRILIRAAQRHSAWIAKQCGVSGAKLWILQELQDAPGMRVGDVAEKLAIHQTTATNLLDALEKDGYITKARHPEDQRAVVLKLSKQGRELLKRAPKPTRALLPEALSRLDVDSLSQLNIGLQALLEAIESKDESLALQPLPFTM